MNHIAGVFGNHWDVAGVSMIDTVEITTGSRLHFGPLFAGRVTGRRFGGVGVMLDSPRCRVSVSRATTNEVLAAAEFVPVVANCLGSVTSARPAAGPVRVEVHEAIPRHRGLGSGTQLTLAVAQGLHILDTGEAATAESLARATGRGLRSAIGIHGFEQGGFLIDAGKRDDESLGTLAARCDVPEDWRFVLIAPRDAAGLSGRSERDAFTKLPPMPATTSAELCRLALTELLPAVRHGDFPAFAKGLFDYGRIVGDYFAPVQGGRFAHLEMSRLAAKLRSDGFAGVAQSSWGPTIAVVTRNETEARELAAVVAGVDIGCVVTGLRNDPARVACGEDRRN